MNFEDIKALLLKDRSVRRFRQDLRLGEDTLKELAALTRYCASGRNAQPLKYRIVYTPRECEALFPALAWAGYFTEWPGPEEGERPVAYLVQCLDTEIGANCLCDDGLQLQAITLGATTMGLGGCIIKAFNMEKVREALNLPERFKPLYVLALGHPAEKVRIVDLGADGDFKYFRDENDCHCVPKRAAADLIIEA